MKLKQILMLLAAGTLFSCNENNDGMIWDIAPINICMYVQDDEGNDLLSESFDDNILEDDIYAVYRGLKFPLGVQTNGQPMFAPSDQEGALSRAYYAVLNGLGITKIGYDYCMLFGEFDGAKDWDESFQIVWGDGTSDTLRFTRDFEWNSDGSPKITNSALYYNGDEVEDKLIIIR